MPKARKVLTSIAATIVATAAAVAIPGVASADEWQCANGEFCMWTDADYRGEIIRFRIGDAVNLLPAPFQDQTSSYINRSDVTFIVYEHQRFQGAGGIIRPGYRMDDMTSVWLYNEHNGVSVNANDAVSSVTSW